MTLALQSVLLAGLMGSSLLLFLMMRQLGVLSRRLGPRSSGLKPALAPGTRCPVQELAGVEGGVHPVPLGGAGDTYLLFVSFSCAACREILEEAPRLPERTLERLVLCFLDAEVRFHYGQELTRLRGGHLRLAEGHEIAARFNVTRGPYLFVVGTDGKIRDSVGLLGIEDLRGVLP